MSEDLCTRRIADYSQTALPYVFTFDSLHSNIVPNANGEQVFSYIVQAYGNGTQINLKKFTLLTCDKINANDFIDFRYVIYNNQIVVTDVAAAYTIGLDPDTQDSGITITFTGDGLSSNDAYMMTFDFTIKGDYTLSEVGVTVFGADGTTKLDGQSVCGPTCNDPTPCDNVVYKDVVVCAEVEVTPNVQSGTVQTKCCGVPKVGVTGSCTGAQKCGFSISQCICVGVPLTFNASAQVTTTGINCDPEDGECDCTCGQ